MEISLGFTSLSPNVGDQVYVITENNRREGIITKMLDDEVTEVCVQSGIDLAIYQIPHRKKAPL